MQLAIRNRVLCTNHCRCSYESFYLRTKPFPIRRLRPQDRSGRLRLQPAAIQVSGPGEGTEEQPGPHPGQVSLELVQNMRDKIASALETKDVTVRDVNGDGRHVAIDVVSDKFKGESQVQRQRMVYRAIWLELQDAVHAVDELTTKTPAEAQK